MADASQGARRWVKSLAVAVRHELERSLADQLVVLLPVRQLSVTESDTDGWYVDLGRVRGVRGSLGVWFDSFPRAGGRRVSVCFQSTQKEWPGAIAKYAARKLGQPAIHDDSVWTVEPDGTTRRVRPLPTRLYRRPILEAFDALGSWTFYVMYLPDEVNIRSRPTAALVTEAANFLAAATRYACGLSRSRTKTGDYPPVTNRMAVRAHLVRERSPRLARLAKERDAFTCQVCRFNFGDRYGRVGRGFAEAHHRVPLGSPKAKDTTTVADLVTVCANCHRMLHTGEHMTLNKLKRAITGWWPA